MRTLPALSMVILLLGGGRPAQPEELPVQDNPAVARVGQWTILRNDVLALTVDMESDLQQAQGPASGAVICQLRREKLEAMLEQALMAEYARHRGQDIATDQLTADYQRFRQLAGPTYERYARMTGRSDTELQELFRLTLLAQQTREREVEQRIAPDENTLKAWYEREKTTRFYRPPAFRAARLTVTAATPVSDASWEALLAEMGTLHAQLAPRIASATDLETRQEIFQAAVREHGMTADAQTGAVCVIYGHETYGDFDESLLDAVHATQVGQLSEVFAARSAGRGTMVLLEDRQPEATVNYEQARTAVRDLLSREIRANLTKDLLARVRAEVPVEVFPEELCAGLETDSE